MPIPVEYIPYMKFYYSDPFSDSNQCTILKDYISGQIVYFCLKLSEACNPILYNIASTRMRGQTVKQINNILDHVNEYLPFFTFRIREKRNTFFPKLSKRKTGCGYRPNESISIRCSACVHSDHLDPRTSSNYKGQSRLYPAIRKFEECNRHPNIVTGIKPCIKPNSRVTPLDGCVAMNEINIEVPVLPNNIETVDNISETSEPIHLFRSSTRRSAPPLVFNDANHDSMSSETHLCHQCRHLTK